MIVLHMFCDDPEIAALYTDRKVCQYGYMPELDQCPDSGFDLICLKDTEIKAGEQVKFDFQVRGAMFELNDECNIRRGYWLVPRSSFNDTPLIMQNSPGVIDSGYNGFICMKVRALADFTVKKGTCLAQLVHPSLRPFSVNFHLGQPPETKRGENGFGSTGNTCLTNM